MAAGAALGQRLVSDVFAQDPASGAIPADPTFFDFSALSREPDVEDDALLAYDATDELLLSTAAETLGSLGPGELVVIGDRHGALTLGAALGHGATDIRVHQDPLLGELALARNAERLGGARAYTNLPLGPELLAGARLVLVQLPRGLDALDEISSAIARWAAPDVWVLAGGRVKHMALAMNDVLRRSFGEVSAGLAVRKSRVLTACAPRAASERGPLRFPLWGTDPDLPFALAAYGATFGGPTLDHGTRLMLRALGESARGRLARNIVDLGCGNGTIAVSLALSHPEASVHATDQSAAAVRAARETALAAGVEDRVSVHRADAADGVPAEWADLIALNPPFHTGATVHAGVAHRLIRAAAPALAPGGELWVVFNTHLGYRPLIERVIGPTRQVARDRTFTVVVATKRGARA